MPAISQEVFLAKKTELMERSFECFADKGLHGTGMRALGAYCGCNAALFYSYFDDLDDLIVQSTEHCMSKVENEFMAKAPTKVEDIEKFIEEIPYWTAKEHGKKYRLMYQVYTHPKYIESGKEFFDGVNKRYTEYAKLLESKIGIPYEKLTPLIFIFVRACVHYAMFEDEFYLKAQIGIIKEAVTLFVAKYAKNFKPTSEK